MNSSNCILGWLLLPVTVIAILITAVCGLWEFTWSTADALHPDWLRMPSIVKQGGGSKFQVPIEEARQLKPM